MSRLDSHIRRLLAQRASIDRAAQELKNLPGPILELGLGSGRTYDHLRMRFPRREIFVFDLHPDSHPASRPDPRYFIQGDFRDTLPGALSRLGAPAVLAHCDIGSNDVAASHALASAVAPLLAPLMRSGGIVLSDQQMEMLGWRSLAPPKDVLPGRYYIYRVEGMSEPPRLAEEHCADAGGAALGATPELRTASATHYAPPED